MRSIILFFALVLSFQVNAQVKLKQLERGTANHQIGVTKGANNVQEYRDAYSYITDTLGIGGDQQLTISNDTIYLENGGFVVLPESGGSLPIMPLEQIHYGNFESDQYFRREPGKLNFSGVINLTYPEGSGKVNANFGDNLNPNVDDFNFAFGVGNAGNALYSKYSFFSGDKNASSAPFVKYCFINGYRNGYGADLRFVILNGYRNGYYSSNIDNTLLNGYENALYSKVEKSFLNGFRNGYNYSEIKYSFSNGFNAQLGQQILYTFLNGYKNAIKGNNLSSSFLNGDENANKEVVDIYYSFLNGERNAFRARHIINSFLSGDRNAYNADTVSNSVLFGSLNGYNLQNIQNSIYIGNRQGFTSGGDNQLAIGMKPDIPLLWGHFVDDKIGLNGTLEIRDVPIASLDYIYGKTSDDITRKMPIADLPFPQISDLLDNDPNNELDTMYNYDGSILAHGDTVKVPEIDLSDYVQNSDLLDNNPNNELDTMYNYDGSILAHGDTVKVPEIDLSDYVQTSDLLDNDPNNELDTMYNYDGSILAHGDTVKVPEIIDEYTDNLAVTGTNTKTITLGRHVGSDITATFTDNQRSDEQIQDVIGGMVTGNTESGIIVTYNDTGGKLNFSASDPSATNELQDLDIAELVGTNLRFSLTNDATIHTISLASLQNSIWSLDGTQAYYNDGVEVRSLANNFADFHIKTPYVDWTFLNTGSSSGGNLRLSPSTNKRFQIATSSNDVFFEFVPSSKTIESDPFPNNYNENTFDYVVRNKSTREWELHPPFIYPETYLRTIGTTTISTSTSNYTKIGDLIEIIDNHNNVTVGGTQDYFQVQKSGRYKVQTTYALTASVESKEFYMAVTRPTNQEVNNRQKGSIIVDTSSTTEVNNSTVVHTVYATLNTGVNYSVSIKRSDSNPGALIVLSDTTVEIEFLGINP